MNRARQIRDFDLPRRADPHSAHLIFSDPDSFSSALPNGKFGVLPLDATPFKASLGLGTFPDEVVMKSIRIAAPVNLRAELSAPPGSIAFIASLSTASSAILDGRDLGDGRIATRRPGDSLHLRTRGKHQIAVVILRSELLLRANPALGEENRSRIFRAPSSLHRIDPLRLRRLRMKLSEIESLIWEKGIDPPKRTALRNDLIHAISDAAATAEIKSDRLATRLQTASMAKIDRHIDESRHNPVGLQELCESTGLALRTIETIVKRRTGLSAHAYLARRRLAFARDALLFPEADANVTQVAMQYGFFHLGRFAGFYRQVYGEYPSATLRRTLGIPVEIPATARKQRSPVQDHPAP